MKRFMARYIFYLEMFGFIAVTLVALAVAACFFFKTDDVLHHVGDAVAIEPKAKTIKRQVDALVTRVFVQNHQNVHQGDVLVEVVEQPEWMSRYLVMHQIQAMLDEFQAPGQAAAIQKQRIEEAQKQAREAALAEVTKKSGPTLTETEEKPKEEKNTLPVVPLTAEQALLYMTAQQQLADWEANEAPRAPRIVLKAPIDGIVVSPDDLPFKQVEADKEILKVVDLNDLRLSAKVEGETIADARTGDKANIINIQPDYKTGMIYRGDTVPKNRWFWQKERITSFAVLDPKIKDEIKDAFKNRKITQRDDIPFDLKDVTDVEVNTLIDTTALARDGATGRRGDGATGRRGAEGGQAYAAAPEHPTPNTEHPTPIMSDLPNDLKLSGKVVEGKHTLKVQIADIPASVVRQVADEVRKKVVGKTFAAPQDPERPDGPLPLDLLHVDALRGLSVVAKMKGENTDAKGPTKVLKRQAAQHAIRGASLERQFEVKIQIQNPPQVLKDRVLELLDEGKQVKAKVEVKTGRRPVAFLLLRR